MSRLIVATRKKSYQMNVVGFSSPMYGQFSSVQVRKMLVHFPIKLAQPEIQFDVVFRGEKEFEEFQRFVRQHQRDALSETKLLTLSWPERNINNWTGVIKQFRGGGSRANYVPRARFQVELINSMVSSRTDISSVSTGWRAIYGALGPVDAVLLPPTQEEALQIFQDTGQNIFDRGTYTNPGIPVPTGNVPVAPAPPVPGIVTGS